MKVELKRSDMPIYIPSSKVIDERVISSFYQVMSREAERQHFSPAVFPVIGDLSLGDLMDEMRRGTDTGLYHYKNVIALGNGSLPKTQVYVDTDCVDARVIESWKQWLSDIGEHRTYKKIHRRTMDVLIDEQAHDADLWRRADTLSRKNREVLTNVEKEELRSLEARLDSSVYSSIRERIKPQLMSEEVRKVAQRYQIPGKGITFAEVFTEIENGSVKGKELYDRLVELHEGYEFRRAA